MLAEIQIRNVHATVRLPGRTQSYQVSLGIHTSCSCSEFRKSGRRKTCRHIEALKSYTPVAAQERQLTLADRELF